MVKLCPDIPQFTHPGMFVGVMVGVIVGVTVFDGVIDGVGGI